MPAATYANTIIHSHWVGGWPEKEGAALALLEGLSALDETTVESIGLAHATIQLIHASMDGPVYELTTQGADYFGHPRPYDCDELASFLCHGREIATSPPLIYRFVELPELAHYLDLLRQLLREPKLFASERAQIEETLDWLSPVNAGRILIVFRQG